MRQIIFFALFLASNAVSYAQTALPSSGEISAKIFYKALQDNDAQALQSFIASKETYLLIADEYQYQQDQQRQKAKARVESDYANQAASITKSFQDVRNTINASGVDIKNCAVALVQVRDRQKNNLRGGRALIQLRDEAGHEIVVIVRGFYGFKGKWYIMDAVGLRTAAKSE